MEVLVLGYGFALILAIGAVASALHKLAVAVEGIANILARNSIKEHGPVMPEEAEETS